MNEVAETELLAPAGDFETALAAFAAGADAVYCGLADFSARAFAKNLSPEELDGLVRYARANGKRVYVTFNTLVDEDSFEEAVETLARLAEIGPDALIVQDLGIARLCRRHFPELVLHASTQLVAHNLEGVLALGEIGFTRVVLARELPLDEISSIARRCGGIELECFVHGALCYSVSGLCLFSALEKGRSGNRGQCAYCCRQSCGGRLPFSMKDLRLGQDARRLANAGIASLKIEGRMKSALYVASVTKYYRQILDGTTGPKAVVQSDLETVFSRRTTELRFDGGGDDVIDDLSLGHLGTPIGTVKRVTRDRDGLRWLRFHTSRALEKHDGLQFAAPDGGKPIGFGISAMRSAISRTPVFEVAAGTDVEILLPESGPDSGGKAGEDPWGSLRTGCTVHCSMSNYVRRMFPTPSYRPSDYDGNTIVDLAVTLTEKGISVVAAVGGSESSCEVSSPAALERAKSPEKTFSAVEKAFSKLGGTAYRLGRLKLVDEGRLFAPPSELNGLRRDLVEALDAERDRRRQMRIEAALVDAATAQAAVSAARRRELRLCAGQPVPAGDWSEVIVAVGLETQPEDLAAYAGCALRLGLPVWNPETTFNRLRVTVKRLVRAGFAKWEAGDLATVRLLRETGVSDITADWTLYAFNAQALELLAENGVRRFVASPENVRENLDYLAESGYDVTFLEQQTTPLFISLHRPKVPGDAEGAVAELRPDAGGGTLAVYRRDGLWITVRPAPRTFRVPTGDVSTRVDLGWDVPRDETAAPFQGQSDKEQKE